MKKEMNGFAQEVERSRNVHPMDRVSGSFDEARSFHVQGLELDLFRITW
jgi:hypothetical protein